MAPLVKIDKARATSLYLSFGAMVSERNHRSPAVGDSPAVSQRGALPMVELTGKA
jgi:hypothetical protein